MEMKSARPSSGPRLLSFLFQGSAWLGSAWPGGAMFVHIGRAAVHWTHIIGGPGILLLKLGNWKSCASSALIDACGGAQVEHEPYPALGSTNSTFQIACLASSFALGLSCLGNSPCSDPRCCAGHVGAGLENAGPRHLEQKDQSGIRSTGVIVAKPST